MTKAAQAMMLMGGIFAALLVAANAAGSKIIDVGPLGAASATVFAYAITFLITDVVSDVFGKEAAGRIVWLGFGAVLLAVGFFQIALVAPSAVFFDGQPAFEKVFGISWRLLLGGLVAYLVSQFLDIRIFHLIKNLTNGRWLWLRNNVSTLISQLVDTSIFITVAFYGVYDELWTIIIGQYLIKVIIAIVDTIPAYLLIHGLKKWLPK